MIMERIDTSINMLNHLTKGISRALFHWNKDFLLDHIPPAYSPVHKQLVGTYNDDHMMPDHMTPISFTTPTTAAAARVCAPLKEDYVGHPWLPVIWHGEYNPLCTYIIDCGGMLQ